MSRAERLWMKLVPRSAAALLLCACAHGEPYSTVLSAADNVPVTGANGITRLTFDSTGDWAAAWLPDSRTVAFSWRPTERTDGDRCLAFMPIPGFRIGRTTCVPTGGVGYDSTSVAVSSAVSAGGRLALVNERSALNLPLAHRTLYLGRADGSVPLTAVLTLPVTASSGLLHGSMEQLAWRGESSLVYVATVPRPIRTDLQSSPLEIGVVALQGGIATTSVVPGTAGASSVSIDPTGGAVYATFVGDSRVYGLDLATGQRQLVVDLAAFGIPRDVRVANGHLAAVVRGRLIPVDSAAYGVATVLDEGGELVFLDLAGGSPVFYQQSFTWFRRISFSPDGQHLVAEGYPVAFIPTGPCCPAPEDTVVNKISDLWLIQWP